MIWTPPMDRIEAKTLLVDRGYATPCRVFTGTLNARGYGQISDRGERWLVHRYVYTQLVGPIPDGLVLDHLCRQHDCHEHTHLEAVTQRENLLRGAGPQLTSQRLGSVTRCTSGHDFTPENTYLRPNGTRACRACKRDRKRAARELARAS